MRNDNGSTEAGKQYAAAYAVHYRTKNLHEALGLYKGIIAAHRDTQEAVYSRSQIRNIVKGVVPEQELLDAQVNLALAHLHKHENQPDMKRIDSGPSHESRQ